MALPEATVAVGGVPVSPRGRSAQIERHVLHQRRPPRDRAPVSRRDHVVAFRAEPEPVAHAAHDPCHDPAPLHRNRRESHDHT
jgi:hypothetical protein